MAGCTPALSNGVYNLAFKSIGSAFATPASLQPNSGIQLISDKVPHQDYIITFDQGRQCYTILAHDDPNLGFAYTDNSGSGVPFSLGNPNCFCFEPQQDTTDYDVYRIHAIDNKDYAAVLGISPLLIYPPIVALVQENGPFDRGATWQLQKLDELD